MRQLSMSDAHQLAVESPKQLLQMATLLILSPPRDGRPQVTRQALSDLVAERIHLAPALRQKLLPVPLGLDYPYWIDDDQIDIDFHVRDFALPPPGDDRTLAEKAAEIVTWPLDHSRPLWELYLVEGLTGGRVAVLLKLHHATVDGVSGMELHSMLFDRAPEGRRVPPRAPGRAEQAPSQWSMLGRGLAGLPAQPLRAIRGGVRSFPYLDQLMPFRALPGLGAVSRGVRRVARLLRVGGEGMLLEGEDLHAPTTALDQPPSGRRSFAFTQVPLDDAKRVKRHFGVTLNDVVVATMTGAARAWLQEIAALPNEPIIGFVPVSVRSDDSAEGGNLVQVMLVPLPTDEQDARLRLMRTHDALRSAKERHRAVPVSAMQGSGLMVMPSLYIRAMRALSLLSSLGGPPQANTIISNVPGPPEPVYVAGSEVEALYPIGGTIAGFGGFSTIVFSYRDSLFLGFIADREGPADPWHLAEAYERSHEELVSLLPRSTPQRARKQP